MTLKKKYKGTEPNPKGFGYCGSAEKVNSMRRGRDGKVWTVKKNKTIKKWVLSDFYINFRKSENKLKFLLDKSIVKFKYVSFEDTLKKDKNWFNKHGNKYPEIQISFTDINLGAIEFKRCACESEFYKYAINTGSISKLNGKERVFYFDLEPSFKIWKNFKKECKKYDVENVKQITYLIKSNKLSKKEIAYVTDKYNLK